MRDKVTLYEKPTCTTCRSVKRILTEHGVEINSVNYFEQPLTAQELKRLLQAAGVRPADAVRKNESAYREFVAGKELSEDELINLMAAHPELIQRPIVVRGDQAVLARPVERLAPLGIHAPDVQKKS